MRTDSAGRAPRIRVISLQRTPERRERFSQFHAELDFEFFDAVDGVTVEAQDLGTLIEPGLRYTPGALGCALSHLALWEMAIRDRTPVTVIEDDAVLRGDFAAKTAEAMGRLPLGWDIVLWGWNFDSMLSLLAMPGISPCVMVFDQAQLRQSISPFKASRNDVTLYRLDKCFGMCAYSISPAGARKYRAMCFPLRDVQVRFPLLKAIQPNSGIDVALNNVYAETNAFVSFPPLAVTANQNATSTTLGNG
jgi:GR25 family glycosyltransferase involved in LPS biosynthesis